MPSFDGIMLYKYYGGTPKIINLSTDIGWFVSRDRSSARCMQFDYKFVVKLREVIVRYKQNKINLLTDKWKNLNKHF